MKTLYCSALQTSAVLGLPHTVLPNTDLNTFHHIGSPTPINRPLMNYFAIGLSPKKEVVNGIYNVGKTPHTPLDGNVYQPIPIRFVKESLDLSSFERQAYRFRKVIPVNGENYVAYFIKKLGVSKPANYFIREEVPEIKTTILSTNSSKILNPVPRPSSDTEYQSSIYQVSYSQPLSAEILAVEFAEILTYADLVLGITSADVNIGEIMVCSGDEMVDPNTNNYELNGVQAMVFLDCELDETIREQEFTFELGSLEHMNHGGL